MATITLYPTSQFYPDHTDVRSVTAGDYTTTTVTPATLVGGGDVADDSDASYVEEMAFTPTPPATAGMQILACTFQTPAGFTPTNFLYQMRAKTPDASYLAAYDVSGETYPDLMFSTTRRDSTEELLSDKSPSFSHAEIYELLERHVDTPTWFSWFESSPAPASLTEPDSAWCWLEFESPDLTDALTGGDLRLEIAMLAASTTIDLPLLDIFEVRMLVVGTSVVLAPPCHIYPRDDDQGVGTAAIWPPPSSQQATGQPGGYY
jgi:hypothetical protein